MATLAELVEQTLIEADLTSGQVDSDDVARLLNQYLAETYEIIVQAHEGYFVTEADFTLTSGESSDELPDDFYQVISLEEGSGTTWTTLDAFEFKDRNSVGTKSWVIHGNQVLIRPGDSAPGTYRLTYVPCWVDLDDDSDLAWLNHWETHGVLGAAISLKETQELPTASLEKRRDAMETRIRNATAKRKGSRRVRDVRRAYPLASDYVPGEGE